MYKNPVKNLTLLDVAYRPKAGGEDASVYACNNLAQWTLDRLNSKYKYQIMLELNPEFGHNTGEIKIQYTGPHEISRQQYIARMVYSKTISSANLIDILICCGLNFTCCCCFALPYFMSVISRRAIDKVLPTLAKNIDEAIDAQLLKAGMSLPYQDSAPQSQGMSVETPLLRRQNGFIVYSGAGKV